MVGDIPRPLFINKKLNQSWRTESKLALVAIALILRRHIWYVKQGNNRKADAILYSWRMES
jgi:hypothetical protein